MQLKQQFLTAVLASALAATQTLGVEGFVGAGQSNMVGPYVNPQPYSGPDLLFGNDYVIKALVDPTDSNASQVDTVSSDNTAGSFQPRMFTNLDAHVGATFGYVPCAESGTIIADWLPTGTTASDDTNRASLFGSWVYRTKQAATNWNMRCSLWWQWESDALAGTPTNQWASNTCYVSDRYFAATGLPIMLAIPQLSNQAAGTHIDATTNTMYQVAARGIVGTHHIIPGPDFSDLTTDDGFHFGFDAGAIVVGDRWAAATITAFYSTPRYAPFHR